MYARKREELAQGRCFSDQAFLLSKGGKIRYSKSTRDYRESAVRGWDALWKGGGA